MRSGEQRVHVRNDHLGFRFDGDLGCGLGQLSRATGTEKNPFEATDSLTERGQHAAEFGETDFPPEAIPALLPGAPAEKSKRSRGKR